MNTNYSRTLFDEEVKKWEEELNEFLLSLDLNTKSHIRSLLSPIIKQTECEHDWIDPNTYENELNKNFLYCRKCGLLKEIKNKSEIKNPHYDIRGNLDGGTIIENGIATGHADPAGPKGTLGEPGIKIE